MDRTDAYIVSMIINPYVHLSWIKKHWGAEWIEKAETVFKDLMLNTEDGPNLLTRVETS
jgi:hypothetical protein